MTDEQLEKMFTPPPTIVTQENSIKQEPLVLVLGRQQRPDQIDAMLLKATESIKNNREKISSIKVPIEGFGDAKTTHPSMIRGAKRKYAEAIDRGLIGLLLTFQYIKEAQEIYAIAYAKAQLKRDGMLKFKQIKQKHMSDIANKSTKSYLRLLMTNTDPKKE